MKVETLSILTLLIIALTACSGEKQEESITEGGMKCGPGKCGASMVDGSAVLVKKKMNILNQMKENDNRRDCVLNARTSKALYNCVRVEETGRLSTKCASDNTQKISNKKAPKKENSSMKCEAGKCGSTM